MTKDCKAAHFTGGFGVGCSGELVQPLLMMCFALDKKMLRWFSHHLTHHTELTLLPSELQVQTLKCQVTCDSIPGAQGSSGDPLLS